MFKPQQTPQREYVRGSKWIRLITLLLYSPACIFLYLLSKFITVQHLSDALGLIVGNARSPAVQTAVPRAQWSRSMTNDRGPRPRRSRAGGVPDKESIRPSYACCLFRERARSGVCIRYFNCISTHWKTHISWERGGRERGRASERSERERMCKYQTRLHTLPSRFILMPPAFSSRPPRPPLPQANTHTSDVYVLHVTLSRCSYPKWRTAKYIRRKWNNISLSV